MNLTAEELIEKSRIYVLGEKKKDFEKFVMDHKYSERDMIILNGAFELYKEIQKNPDDIESVSGKYFSSGSAKDLFDKFEIISKYFLSGDFYVRKLKDAFKYRKREARTEESLDEEIKPYPLYSYDELVKPFEDSIRLERERNKREEEKRREERKKYRNKKMKLARIKNKIISFGLALALAGTGYLAIKLPSAEAARSDYDSSYGVVYVDDEALQEEKEKYYSSDAYLTEEEKFQKQIEADYTDRINVFYIVEEGDTLSKIGTFLKEMKFLEYPEIIYPGDEIYGEMPVSMVKEMIKKGHRFTDKDGNELSLNSDFNKLVNEYQGVKIY